MMRAHLPRQTAVPQTWQARLEILHAVETLREQYQDEPLRRRRPEIASLRRELNEIALALEELRRAYDPRLRSYVLKYSPDQPRVPAGNPDGGQWTNEIAVAFNEESEVLSDAPDATAAPWAQSAQARGGGRRGGPIAEGSAGQEAREQAAFVRWQQLKQTVREVDPDWKPAPYVTTFPSTAESNAILYESWAREAEQRLSEIRASSIRRPGYPIDLLEQDSLGGHIYEEHVGKSDQYLRNRVRSKELPAAGSFTSVEAANKLINSTVSAIENQTAVDSVARGALSRKTLDYDFSRPTGYEAFARSPRSEPEMRATYGVRVVIEHDACSLSGFRVVTAFPRNSR